MQPWNFEALFFSQHEMTVASHTKCRVLFCRVPRCRVPFCRAPRCRVPFFREVRGAGCYTCRNSAQQFRNPSTADHRHPRPILLHLHAPTQPHNRGAITGHQNRSFWTSQFEQFRSVDEPVRRFSSSRNRRPIFVIKSFHIARKFIGHLICPIHRLAIFFSRAT